MKKPLVLFFCLIILLWVLAFVGCKVSQSGKESLSLIETALRTKIDNTKLHSALYSERVVIKDTGEVFIAVENPFNEAVSALIVPYCKNSEEKEVELIKKQFVNLKPEGTQILALPIGKAKDKYYFCTINVNIQEIKERLQLTVEYA